MNSQTLILERIAAAIDGKGGILLIHDPAFSNTGTLRTLDSNTLEQIASVSYEFQEYAVAFGPRADRVAALWYDSPETGSATWVARSIPDLVNGVVKYLVKEGA